MHLQRCTLALPIPLIPLWAVQTLQSLSACTTLLVTLPKPLPPLWAVQPVQSLSACTTMQVTFAYTSTTLMDRQPVQSLSTCTKCVLYPAYTTTPSVGLTLCTEPRCLYNGALYLYLYLYSPYGSYSRYRTSVPVQTCTLSLPIHLRPLWTVRPPLSLSACTKVPFSFTYNSNPPFCRVKNTLLPIPLIPLWSVRPVQGLIGSTTVHFTFTCNSTPPMGRTSCTEPQCLYNGTLYLYLYLYSHYGPYGLYRASVPVQRYTLSLPIPLFPLWAVRPVQSLSAFTTFQFTSGYISAPSVGRTASTELKACTTVHFIFTYTSPPPMDRTACREPQCLYNGALYIYLYLYSPYRPYGLYRASVPVQRYTLTLPIPLLPLWTLPPVQCLSARTTVHYTLPIHLLPLWTVRPVQSLSACTTVHFNFTYTSTPPMDRAACTEPQCLFNGALYLYLYL